jgi:hypothetical protein
MLSRCSTHEFGRVFGHVARVVPAATLMLASAGVAVAGQGLVVGSPFLHAQVQDKPNITILTQSPEFAAIIAQLRGVNEVTIADFPVAPGVTLPLHLRAVDPFQGDPSARVIVVGSDGVERPAPRPDVLLFSGEVHGVPGSTVFLSIAPAGANADGGHNGWISTGDSKYIFTSGPVTGPGVPVVYDTAAIPNGTFLFPPSCGGALMPPGGPLPALPALDGDDLSPQNLPCRTVVVAVETDWEYTNRVFGGNTTASAAYAATLFSAVGEIYQRDLRVTLQTPFIRVFGSNNDPYPDGANVIDRLYQLTNHWNASMGAVQRNNTHLLTGVFDGAGGVAFLNGLCNGNSYASSGYINGSFPYPLRNRDHGNWDVMVVAHEMGHNFAAPHTHDMSPQVDGCGTNDCSLASQGTIMSYCHVCSGGLSNISLTLQERMINERILPYLGSLTSCITPVNPLAIDVQPRGATRFAGQAATIAVGASGPSIRYQWRKNGINIPGATNSFLNFNPIGVSDAGTYSVVVSNPCNSITSIDAVVRIVFCDGDYNRDGTIDLFDYLDFVAAFDAGTTEADVNSDGAVDFFDYLDFVNTFNDNCP